MKKLEFQHPELIKCNPLIEQTNETDKDEESVEEIRIKPTVTQQSTKPTTSNQHPSTSSSALIQQNVNVFSPATLNINQQQQPTFMVGTAGPGATYRRPLVQQVKISILLYINLFITLLDSFESNLIFLFHPRYLLIQP